MSWCRTRLEVALYLAGMLLLGTGSGLFIASLDPRPLPEDFWQYLVLAGILLVTLGIVFLVLIFRLPRYPKSALLKANITTTSAVDLLDDSQAVELKDLDLDFDDLEPMKVVQSCMMMRSAESSQSGIYFSKETIV